MLKLDSQGSVVLDQAFKGDVSEAVVERWLNLEDFDPFYPLEVIGSLPWYCRATIREVVNSSTNEDLKVKYQEWSRRCAGFTFPSGEWDLKVLPLCHVQTVRTWAIEEFYVTTSGIKLFKTCSGPILTDFEFAYVFDQTVVEHLNEHKEVIADHMDIVIEQYESEIVEREVTLAGEAGVETVLIKCLKASGPDNWHELGDRKLLVISDIH